MMFNQYMSQLSSPLWRLPTVCVAIISFMAATYASVLSAEEKTPPPRTTEGATEGATGSVTAFYDLVAEGYDIGDISVTRKRPADNSSYHIAENLSVKIPSGKGQWEMTLTGKTAINHDGIVSFDYKIKENQQNWRIFGERHGLELWCAARKLLTPEERDEEDLATLLSIAITNTVPYAGDALTVVSLLDPDNGGEGEVRIPLNTFDTTTTQLVSFLMNKPKGLQKETFKVLNTAELTIETLTLEEVKQEQLELSGQTFNSRVFKATKAKGESTYWLAEDDLGAFLVKESGKDKDGPYEIILKKYNGK